jgi:hypothetical protein
MLVPKLTRRFAVGMLILLLAACATRGTAPEWGSLQSSVEALYLNYWDLKRLHSDLHNVALVHLEASGPQLAEIQSAARFIHQANLIAFYQWELLSITAYIRDSARYDFFTLRERSLSDARDKSNDLILSTRVYDAFIHDTQAAELIDACIVRIEKHRALYLQMIEELGRLKQKLRPTTASADKSLTPPSLSYKSGNSKGFSDS